MGYESKYKTLYRVLKMSYEDQLRFRKSKELSDFEKGYLLALKRAYSFAEMIEESDPSDWLKKEES